MIQLAEFIIVMLEAIVFFLGEGSFLELISPLSVLPISLSSLSLFYLFLFASSRTFFLNDYLLS